MTYTRETITRRTNTMNDEHREDFKRIEGEYATGIATRTPAGLGAQTFEQALATTIEPPPTHTSGLPVIRAESFRYDPDDGDVMVTIRASNGMALEVAVDDPLALLAVTMAAIKFGHGPEMLVAAQKLVADFGKEPTR